MNWLNTDSNGSPDLTFAGWLGLLSGDWQKSDERVVVVGRVGVDGTIKVAKDQWKRGLKDFPGLVPGGHEPNELVAGGAGGRILSPGKEMLHVLKATPKSTLCITEGRGGYFLKSLVLKEADSDMPGWIVIDRYRPLQVDRWWASHRDPAIITDELLEQFL